MKNEHPVWWKPWSELGYICLPSTELENALSYFKSQDFTVADMQAVVEYATTTTELIKSGLRRDPDIILLDATLVTVADMPTVKYSVSIGASRLVFIGENSLLPVV